jgi:ubiquinol-cytochrome c reductase iron-sulfur subunit
MAVTGVITDGEIDFDESRRRLPVAATAIGAPGAAFSAAPFIESWTPSERAPTGAPTDLDLPKVDAGSRFAAPWNSGRRP